MEKFIIPMLCHFLALLFISDVALAGGKADPLLTMVSVDELELRDTDEGNAYVLEGDVWIGKDLHKLWFKTELERVDGKVEELELQALYSMAKTAFWDLQVGLRHDFKPEPTRNWAVVGLQGVAPYFLEVDSALFVGESGLSGLRLEAEYELLFTQRLILSPEIEANFYSKDDAELAVGSGLSDIEAGLRLRYEVRREFAPYIGVNWSKKFGSSASFSRADNEPISDVQWVIGIKAWF